MIRKKKLGIYGGTFSPPHSGHVGAAEAFSEAVSLDELLIMPDFLPPHKQIDGEVDALDRIQMCKLAFSHIPKACVSDLEIKRGGKSYTALTLEELSGEDRELYFLCGTDMFLTLGEWYMPEKIFEKATICYVRRECDDVCEQEISARTREYLKRFDARIIPISAPVKVVSSSELRLAIKENSPLAEELLPKKVFEYIKFKGLYV